ncbi:MFS transporter [Sedimentibacter sp.]|uniref:MFS transporter n=1 Tax=Sedimentibacter sp. TaxID=1960295 RepID=UPI0028A1F007|nr:MFS transporter [Sedimentibacter sp.]
MQNQLTVNRNAMLIRSLIIMLFAGIINSTAVFVSPLAAYYGWETAAVANVGSTMLLFWPIGSIIGGKIMAAFGAKKATITGAVLFGAGLLLTGLVPKYSPWLIYITFSFMIGLGNGIAYTAATYTATSWFPDKIGLASGLCMGINGGSSAFLAPLCSYLTYAAGIKTCLLIMGTLCCAAAIICGYGLQQAPKGYVPKGWDSSKSNKNLDSSFESYNASEAVKTRPFWHVFICMAFFPTLYLIMFPRFSVFITDKGFSVVLATLGVSLYNIASSVGRLGLGALIDKIGYKKIYAICWACNIGSAFMLIFGNSVASILTAYILIGAGFGATNSVYPVTLTKSFGPMYTGAIYGFALLGYMVSTQVIPRISNLLIASTGGYQASFTVALVLCTIAVASMILVPKLDRKKIMENKN